MAKGDIKKLYEENKDDIIQKRLSGIQIKDIAKEYKINKTTLTDLLNSDNITIRPKLCNDDYKDILMRYKNGETMTNIAKCYGVGTKRISDYLKSQSVTLRTYSDFSRKYFLDEEYFDKIDTPNKAYILGLLYADGCCFVDEKTNRYNLIIALQETDIHILEDVKKELQYTGIISHIDLSKKRENGINTLDQERLCISNKHLVESLGKLGVVPRKTYCLTFPNFLSDNLIPHFFRGLSDGDGCILKTEARWKYAGTYDLLIGIKDYIKSNLGINSSVYKNKYEHENIYRLSIAGGKQVKKFLDYIYKDADLKLNRKYELYLNKYCKAA